MFSGYFLDGQSEICDNGLDDDGDMLVDLNDDDCDCSIIEPVSLIPNPSFEDMACCPTARSQIYCAAFWIQASEPTTDYIHTCDWMGWDQFPPPQPFPDGQGIIGFRDGRIFNGNVEPYFKEYAGACLNSHLIGGDRYRFQFDVGFVDPEKSPPINIAFFGTSDCDFLPFGIGNNAYGCPSNSPNWTKLGEVNVSGELGDKWVNTFIDVIPQEDIHAIAIGPNCGVSENSGNLYYFFDNLLLADYESFILQINDDAHPCDEAFTLSIPYIENYEYQWFLEGVALDGEILPELSDNYGPGNYNVMIMDGSLCRISGTYNYIIPEFFYTESMAICEGNGFQFGDLSLTESGEYIDTFKNRFNCDSIVHLQLEVNELEYDTLEVSILDGESITLEGQTYIEEGEYKLTITRNEACDLKRLIRITNYDIFIPNVFSPNNDGVNDTFFPQPPQGKVQSYLIKIYDRWGNLLYSGEEWDGMNSARGAYIYSIQFEFINGETKYLSGSLTLLK